MLEHLYKNIIVTPNYTLEGDDTATGYEIPRLDCTFLLKTSMPEHAFYFNDNIIL